MLLKSKKSLSYFEEKNVNWFLTLLKNGLIPSPFINGPWIEFPCFFTMPSYIDIFESFLNLIVWFIRSTVWLLSEPNLYLLFTSLNPDLSVSFGFYVEATVFLICWLIGSDDFVIMILCLFEGCFVILSHIPFNSFCVTTSLSEI